MRHFWRGDLYPCLVRISVNPRTMLLGLGVPKGLVSRGSFIRKDLHHRMHIDLSLIRDKRNADYLGFVGTIK